MRDIVERLRESTDFVRHEAADEIASLRHDIEQLVRASADLATENERLRAALQAARVVARRALEGK